MDLHRPLIFTKETYEIVNTIATSHQIETDIVDAIITIESAWNPLAIRYEPLFRYTQDCDLHAKENGITSATEERLQMFSLGLMQVMGGTARAFSYRGNLLSLTDPTINVSIGCAIINKLQKRYDNLNDIVAAYNAGSVRKTPDNRYYNQAYVDKFNAAYRTKV